MNESHLNPSSEFSTVKNMYIYETIGNWNILTMLKNY